MAMEVLSPKHPQHQQHDLFCILTTYHLVYFLLVTQPVSQAESTCVNDMVEAIARSGSSVKSQQKGDAELTLDQRREELMQQYRSRPLVFLERYHVSVQSC